NPRSQAATSCRDNLLPIPPRRRADSPPKCRSAHSFAARRARRGECEPWQASPRQTLSVPPAGPSTGRSRPHVRAAARFPCASDNIPAGGRCGRTVPIRARHRNICTESPSACGEGRSPDRARIPRLPRRWYKSRAAPLRSYVACQSDAAELPTRGRWKEVAIGGTYVPGRRRARAAAQHHLAAHELAVIFGQSSVERLVAGIGIVGRPRLFPNFACGFGLRRFPFEFRRQPRARPCRIGGGFEEAHMRHRLVGIEFLRAVQREHAPSLAVGNPIERRVPALRLYRRPSVGKPEFGPPVAAVLHEGE